MWHSRAWPWVGAARGLLKSWGSWVVSFLCVARGARHRASIKNWLQRACEAACELRVGLGLVFKLFGLWSLESLEVFGDRRFDVSGLRSKASI